MLIKWLNLICLFGCEGEIFHSGADPYSQTCLVTITRKQHEFLFNSAFSVCIEQEYVLTLKVTKRSSSSTFKCLFDICLGLLSESSYLRLTLKQEGQLQNVNKETSDSFFFNDSHKDLSKRKWS